jgi:signal transduction histidine kinase
MGIEGAIENTKQTELNEKNAHFVCFTIFRLFRLLSLGFAIYLPSLFLCFCVFCGESTTLAQSQFPGAEPLYVWQQSQRLQRDYIEALKKQSATEPGNLSLQLNLGRAYHWLALSRGEGALIEGERLFKDILARDPDNAVALAYYGSLLGLKIGDRLVPENQIGTVAMQSSAALDRAVALAPDSLEVRQARGYASLYTPSIAGRDGLAIEDFAHVIELLKRIPGSEERQSEVHLVLGDAYRKMGEMEEARAQWKRARALQPAASIALAAEARLQQPGENDTAIDIKRLTAVAGFLIGVMIYGALAALVLRDLVRLRQRSLGMLASLIVALVALCWNGTNLVAAVSAAIDLNAPGLLAHWQQHYLILLLAPIPVGLAVIYRFHKATFMDLALKRGTALLAALSLSLVYAHLMSGLMRWITLRFSGDTLRWVFFAGMWLWIYALYPPLRGVIYRLFDRHLFKRRGQVQLLDRFNAQLRRATDERSLLTTMAVEFQTAFAAAPVKYATMAESVTTRLASLLDKRKADLLLREQIADAELEAELAAERVELALAVRPNDRLAGMFLIGPRAYDQPFLSEELGVLRAVAAQLSRTMENLRLHEAQRKHALAEEELRRLLAQAELKALRAQIDPHFFFNSLNSVTALIHRDAAAAEALLADLADLFRHAFKPSREFVALEEELQLIETYLKVEQVRLGDKLRFRKCVTPEALAVRVPALTIQPLVENAVRHGVSGGGSITLTAALKDDRLKIIVADTGAGIAPSLLRQVFSRGTGLSNVGERLLGLYGEQSRLRIDSQPGEGTTISFSIPLAIPGTGAGADSVPAGISAK